MERLSGGTNTPHSIGIRPATVAPWPGLEVIVASPPSAPSPSLRLVRPWPSAHLGAVKTHASVRDFEMKRPAGHLDVNADAGAVARMLDGVLQSLQATEVRGALDRRRKTTKISAIDLDRNGHAPSRGGHGRGKSVAGQELRVEPMRECRRLPAIARAQSCQDFSSTRAVPLLPRR